MKRYTSDQLYDSLEMIQLQRYEHVFEAYLKEYHRIVNELEELKHNDKQKTVRYKENFGRKLFLKFMLDEAVKFKIIEKEDLL